MEPEIKIEPQFERVHFIPARMNRWQKYWEELGNMVQVITDTDGSTRGQFCPFDENQFCREGDCRDCQVYLDAIGKADEELGLSRVVSDSLKVKS